MKPISAQTSFNASITSASPEVMLNPVTGDRMTILHSSQTSGGTYAKFQFDLPSGASGSPLHYHTRMSETFTVLAGSLEMEVGRKGTRRTLQAGDSLHVPPGVHHSFRNASSEWVTFTSENRPSEGFERFIRGMFGLAIDGKVNHEGMPTNLLQLALLLKHGDIVLVGVPSTVQRLVLGTLVQLAYLLKAERSLLKYWNAGDRSRAQ